MKTNYYRDGSRMVIVFDEMTPEEEEAVRKALPKEGKVDDAWLKPIEIYRQKFLNGPYAGKTVAETLNEGGDAAFLWVSKLTKCGLIRMDETISGALNGYLMSRFRDVDDPERYIQEKDEDACNALIRVFACCVPGKILAEAGCAKAEDVLKKNIETKRAYLIKLVLFCHRLARKYAH